MFKFLFSNNLIYNFVYYHSKKIEFLRSKQIEFQKKKDLHSNLNYY